MTTPVLAIVLGLVSADTALSQGQLVFDNRVNNIVVAPVYGLEPGSSTTAKRGNTPAGTPSGTQAYGGPLVEGAGYLAQLFGGPPHAAAQNLQAVQPATVFRTGNGAGFVLPPPSTVTVPGVAEGAAGKVQLRVWSTRGGTITNWAQVESDPSIPHGESWPFLTGPLGGPFRAPPNLAGMESFNLATGAAPALVLRINFQPADAPVPTGYRPDAGLPFGARGAGLSYGWNAEHGEAARDRDDASSPDQRHDTFVVMGPNSVWELEVPSGVFGVHLAAGDASATNGQARLALEGVTVLQGGATPAQRWVESDALVEVRDGRLTLSGFAPPVTNRLCFVEVTRIEPVRLEAPTRLARGSPFTLQFTGEAGFRYQLETSAAAPVWEPAGPAAPLFDGRFRFVDPASTNLSRLYRARTLLTPGQMTNDR